MRVLFFDTKPRNPNRYIARAVYDALERHPKVEEAVFADYRDAASIARDTRFDALIAFDGEEAKNPILRRLTELVGRRAIWFTEDPYEPEANRQTAELFDLVFTNDQASVAGYRQPAFHLPLAADEEQCFFPVDRAPPYDVFFCGTAWPNRLEFLDGLRRRLPELRMRLELASNEVLDRAAGDLLKRFEIGRGVAIHDFCRLANQSRVTLVLPRVFSGSADSRAASDTPGPRIFEGALAGACQLVDVSTTPLASRYFEDGREIATFSSLDDCVDRIRTLVADQRQRIDIATAAQEAVRARHLYDHRVGEILDRLLPAARSTPRPRATERRKVLFVTHNMQAFGHFGGTEVYLEALRTHIRDVDPLFFVRDRRVRSGHRYILLDGTLKEIAVLEPAVPYDSVALVHREVEAFLVRSITEHDVALVHFIHMLGFPPSLPLLARALGVPSVLTVLDHFTTCERFNLLDQDERYCRIAERPESICDGCLAQAEGRPPGSQARRRRFFRESLAALDLVIAPSLSTQEIFLGMFPHLRGRTAIEPLPVAPATRACVTERPDDQPLHVALLGNFTGIKGARTALSVFAAAEDRPFHFHIFGRIDPEFVAPLARFKQTVTVHGVFTPGQLPDALFGCQAGLFLSTWPETYLITLTEAQLAGIVPIVTAVGAQQERVVPGVDGFIVAIDDSRSILEALESLVDGPEGLAAMQALNRAKNPVDPAAYARWIEEHYRRLIDVHTPRAPMRADDRWLSWDELGISLQSPYWVDPAGGGDRGSAELSGGYVGHYARRFFAVSREQGLYVGLLKARERIAMIFGRS